MHQEITKNYKYKFSVVIPIYNVEDYVEETILSVINQTIGFKENIQMILVNDGSPDNSEDVCFKYKDKYPNNVIYVKQENGGVSKARNNGMNYIEGKYVNFLDSDDKWDLDAFEKVYKFFEKNYMDIDLVACRINLFESQQGFKHALDYKFNKDKVVDIFESYDNIQLSSASVFFKADIIKKYKYDTQLKYTEDGKLLGYIILEREKYGIMRSVVYNYRKRATANSAIDSGSKNESWYTDTVERCYKDLFKYSIEKYGVVIPYIQYQIMYDLQWRLKINISDIIGEATKNEYIENIKWLLSYIEDHIICNQKKMVIEYKIYALSLKYNKDIRKEIVYDKGKLYFNNINIYSIQSKHLLNINIIDIKNGHLELEGKVKTILLKEDYEIYIIDDKGNRFNLECYEINFDEKYSFDNKKVLDVYGFKVKIKAEDIKSIKFFICYRNRYIKKLNLNFGKFAKISKNYNKSYYYNENYIIRQNKNRINIYSYNKNRHFRFEFNYIKQLLKEKRCKIVLYRIIYYILKPFINKDIWIISDRTHAANDNGMHLFKYINMQDNNDIKVYFAINKECDDYKKVKKYGKVVKMDSLKYKLLFLYSSKIISSHADEWVINAFDKKRGFLKDLYKFDFIFLQHGITKDDLSSWLHKQHKNIKLFITAVEDEFKSIVYGSYGYDRENVKLTGFPRFDFLKCSNKRQIVIMPTWRKNISKDPIKGTSLREYDDNFKNTNYFEFYNNLINDKRVLDILMEKKYTAKFCIHPSFEQQAIDFKSNDYVDVSTQIPDYQKEFNENELLITDYSSVAFDFAYLKKPVIYTQFDKENFFQGHTYNKGYFDYEENGFGIICYNYETSVNEIVDMIKNGCEINKKYIDRIDSFYQYTDNKNCKRVYKEILKLK
ncbi:bifunctional glycosyltransferase/CDP-glycerol:glycerophosphate glycerophosphotransferase [Terrisporobacter vanillatitrophus]|uniref:bifunctional glycosyltransferase/CDP-glycerol:glycerophosphate glycerophosphotransferase n=1 Tax=Terrisporobacter vanillatitrophus TaxID=3058402 RepID=UPI0033698C1F